MDRMVISCFPDGTAQHLLKDSFLNPFPGMRREIKRISLIEFDEDKQKFFIRFRGDIICHHHLHKHFSGYKHFAKSNAIMYFGSYESAVATEIDLVNSMMLSGESL